MNRSSPTYQLVDFGLGRKLERFNGVLVDRPSPAAEAIRRQQPDLWRDAALRFDRKPGLGWEGAERLSEEWRFDEGSFSLLLRPTPFGHLGVFPEQAENWSWFRTLTANQAVAEVRSLNLFGYTGASTLALAALGCPVTHVDASKPTLAWARENACHSGLDTAPIRWIQEDARLFVDREIRRGNQYELVLLDPPTYGHGPKGKAWSFERDMPHLLEAVFDLLSDRALAVLWTGHTETDSLRDMIRSVADKAGHRHLVPQRITRSGIVDESHRKLDCGYQIRWIRKVGKNNE
jgi:23S rRNA (cytosine1962-C5)-methyltransferase